MFSSSSSFHLITKFIKFQTPANPLLLESLHTESKDNANPFLIGYRILGLHSVTNGIKIAVLPIAKIINWNGPGNKRYGKEQVK